jgi:hypothetical protein
MNISAGNNTILADYPHTHVFEATSIKLAISLIFFLNLFIGNILWAGIIHFEKYGGDPQKRSITNRLGF